MSDANEEVQIQTEAAPVAPVEPTVAAEPSAAAPAEPSVAAPAVNEKRMSVMPPQQDSGVLPSYSNEADQLVVAPVLDEKSKDEIVDMKRSVLASYDDAEFSWFHLKTMVVAGVGFFTDSYDLFAISLVVPMLGFVYFNVGNNPKTATVPSTLSSIVKGASSVGTLVGQLVFGMLADSIGRKRMYGVELIIIILATVAQATSAQWARGVTAIDMLSFWRLFVGFGIGGDYPLSAIITSEFATLRNRGAMIAAVFAMQGIGYLVSVITAIILLACFEGAIRADTGNIDYVWRLLIFLGIIPACCALYYRLTLPETPRYNMEVNRDLRQAAKDASEQKGIELHDIEKIDQKLNITSDDEALKKPNVRSYSFKELAQHFWQWKNLSVLLGCSLSWFFLDVAYYGVNLNQSTFLKKIGYTNNTTFYDSIWTTIIGNLILISAGNVPGFWFTVAFVDRVGRIPIQLMGFTFLTIIFFVLGGLLNSLNTASLVTLITLAQFFFNFGPNSTTFIIPGEVFPTRFRSTGHGISAATGKAGAILASFGFDALKDYGGATGSGNFIPSLMLIFGGFMAAGIFTTLLIPETGFKTLEELSNDQEEAGQATHPAKEATYDRYRRMLREKTGINLGV